MNGIFKFQDVLEVVTNGVQELSANLSLVQRTAHRDAKRKIANPFFIHQSVEAGNFDKISHATCSKEA